MLFIYKLLDMESYLSQKHRKMYIDIIYIGGLIMKVGNLGGSSLEHDLCILTKDGGSYLVHNAFIACVDRDGNYTGASGTSFEDAVEILRTHGEMTVLNQWASAEVLANPDYKDQFIERVFVEGEIQEIYSVPRMYKGQNVVQISRPKKTLLGIATSRLCDLLR